MRLLILVAASSLPSNSLPNWYFDEIVHAYNSHHHVSPAVHPLTHIHNPDKGVLQPAFNEDGSRRCSASNPCPLKAGDCHYDEDCAGSLKCGSNNCKLEFGLFSQENKRWDLHDDCCAPNDNFCNQELLYPKSRRTCCSPSNPCPHGHGECEKDADCEGSLICGDKNCFQFYDDAGPRDDCCVYPKLAWVGGPHDWHTLEMQNPAKQDWYRSLAYNVTASTGHA